MADREYSLSEVKNMGAQTPGYVPDTVSNEEYSLGDITRMQNVAQAPAPAQKGLLGRIGDKISEGYQNLKNDFNSSPKGDPNADPFSAENWQAKKNALKTAANDLTLNHYPNLAAAAKTGSFSSPEYIAQRDEERKGLEAVPPSQALAGHAGGLIAAAGLPAASAPNALGRVAIAGGTGAATGFLQNPGEEAGKLSGPQFAERGKQAIAGGLLGGLPAAGLEGASLIATKLQSIVPSLESYASKKAVKQAGAMVKELRALEQKPNSSVQEAGKMLLDKDVVTPLASLRNIADRSQELIDEHGAKTGAVAKILDSKLPEMQQAGSPLVNHFPTGNKIADRIEANVIDPIRDSPVLQNMVGPLQERADAFRTLGNAPVPFEKAEQWKRQFDDLLNWDKQGPLGSRLLKRLRGNLNGVIEDGVENIGASTHSPVFQDWKESKKIYGVMKDINDMAEDRLLRNNANRSWSPSDYLATLGGAAVGAHHDPVTAAIVGGAVGGANHLARSYGPGIQATGSRALSEGLQAAPATLEALKNQGLIPMGLIGGKLGARQQR